MALGRVLLEPSRTYCIWTVRTDIALGTSAARGLQVRCMGDAEDLDLLRGMYERALASFQAVSLTLNRNLLAGTHPSPEDLQRERDARAELARARSAYLDACMRALGSS